MKRDIDLEHEIRLRRIATARDIIARAIGCTFGDDDPSPAAVDAANRAIRALIAAGLTVQDLS